MQVGVAGKLKQLLIERFEKLRLGHPVEDRTNVEPQADSKQANAVSTILDTGAQEGKILTGGKRSDAGTNFVAPTIFEGMLAAGRINVEEVFGPVLVLHAVSSAEEAIQLANNTECTL